VAINETWHRQHPTPTRASLEERVRWHTEHAKECGCRPMPAEILIELEKRERRGQKKSPRKY
jgi:hypothetical protein